RPDILVSPCDAIVGACGTIAGTELYQAKGFPYTLEDLLGDRALVEAHRDRPDILVSPCDAIVGACGTIAGTELYQAKGFPYTLEDLLGDRALVEAHRNGRYVTLRLT